MFDQLKDVTCTCTPFYPYHPLWQPRKSNECYIIGDVTIPFSALPKDFPSLSQLFPSTTERLLEWFKHMSVAILVLSSLAMPAINAKICQKSHTKAKIDVVSGRMRCDCGAESYKFFSTCPILRTIHKVPQFLRFVIYMCSTKCLIRNAREYTCGKRESENYISVFFAVWNHIKNHWSLQFGNNCSQDGSVFGKVGHKKYEKIGPPKPLPPWKVDKVIDCNPSAKHQYRRFSKVTKSESCYENYRNDLYLPVPEGARLNGDLGAPTVGHAVKRHFFTQGCNHSKGEYSAKRTIDKRYNSRITNNHNEGSNKTDKMEAKLRNGLIDHAEEPERLESWLNYLDDRNNYTNNETEDVFSVFLQGLA